MQDNNQSNNQAGTDGDQPIVEPVLPFIPKIANPNSQIVTAGGIESGPVRVESPVMSADLKVPEIEKPAENIERMEVKEPKPPVTSTTTTPVVTTDDKKDEKQVEEKKEEVKPTAFEPKYSGHKIDPSIYANTDDISKNAGSGDPALARTAIYILLDRLFKKGIKV